MFKVALWFIFIFVATFAGAIAVKNNSIDRLPQRVCIAGHSAMVMKWVPKAASPGVGTSVGALKRVRREEFICDRNGDYRIQDLKVHS